MKRTPTELICIALNRSNGQRRSALVPVLSNYEKKLVGDLNTLPSYPGETTRGAGVARNARAYRLRSLDLPRLSYALHGNSMEFTTFARVGTGNNPDQLILYNPR